MDANVLFNNLPIPVKKLLHEYQNTLYVGGGYLRDTLLAYKINDIDLFCNTLVKKEVCRKLESLSDSVIVTDNAMTFRIKDYPIIQVITKWYYTSVLDMINDFDFTVMQIGMTVVDDKPIITSSPTFLSDLNNKRLVYTSPIRNENTAGSFLRMFKFLQRGYKIDRENIARITGRLISSIPNVGLDDEGCSYTPDFNTEVIYYKKVLKLFESNVSIGGY